MVPILFSINYQPGKVRNLLLFQLRSMVVFDNSISNVDAENKKEDE